MDSIMNNVKQIANPQMEIGKTYAEPTQPVLGHCA